MALDRIALILKVGDQQAPEGLEWTGFRHLDPLTWIDEQDWGDTLENILSQDMRRIFCVMQVGRNMLPYLKANLVPTHDTTDEEPDTLIYRPRLVRFDLNVIKSISGDPDIEAKLLSKDTVVDMLNATEISDSAFKDATLISNSPEVKDVNVITSGSANVGSGQTYTTWQLALADVGSLTGNLTFTGTSATTEATQPTVVVALGGFTIECNGASTHLGNYNNGFLTTVSHSANNFSIAGTGGGDIKVHHFKMSRTVTASTRGLITTNGSAGTSNYYAYNNILQNNGNGDQGFRITDPSPIFYIYNNMIVDGAAGGFLATAGDLNASSILENNSVHGSPNGISLNTIAATLRNNMVFDNSTACFVNQSAAIAKNNACSDATGEDADFGATSANNLASLTIANEVDSTTIGDGDTYLRPKSTGSLINAGFTTLISGHTTYIDGTTIGASVHIGAKSRPGGILRQMMQQHA